MLNGFSQPRGVVPEPLVAYAPKKSVSFIDITLWHNPAEACQQLTDYEKSQDISKNSQGEYVVVAQLRSFLTHYRHRINVTFYGTRFIHRFIPYHRLGSRQDQENSEHLRELRLAKCLACLQLLADPNLPAHDIPNQPITYLLNDFFTKNRFSQNNLNLLFSYGLSYHSFYEAFQICIKQTETDPEQSWRQLLEHCLSGCASSEEKDAFAKKYKICRDALNIIEKHNPYIQCYEHLKQAYISYLQNNYRSAAGHYYAAEKLLTSFQSDKTLSPLIVQDYVMRAEKCATYYKVCQRLAEKKHSNSSNVTLLISQCFYNSEKMPRLSNETAAVSSDEEEDEIYSRENETLLLGKVKYN